MLSANQWIGTPHAKYNVCKAKMKGPNQACHSVDEMPRYPGMTYSFNLCNDIFP
jgi:hypothetical protein